VSSGAELTHEELAYVGRSLGRFPDDAVELLELTDDEPADLPGSAAIDDVPIVDPADLTPLTDAPSGPIPVAGPFAVAGPLTGPGAISVPSPLTIPGPRTAPGLSGPVGGSVPTGAGSSELIDVLVPAAGTRPAGEPAVPDGLPAAAPVDATPDRRAPLTPSSFEWTAALPAGVPASLAAGPAEPAASVPKDGATGRDSAPHAADPLGFSVTLARETPAPAGLRPAGAPFDEEPPPDGTPVDQRTLPDETPPAWWFLPSVPPLPATTENRAAEDSAREHDASGPRTAGRRAPEQGAPEHRAPGHRAPGQWAPELLSAEQQPDDPNTPTRPLRLVPAWPPR
jgi:hypothetical protein